MRGRTRRISNLSLNVDSSEGRSSGAFKDVSGFAGQEGDILGAILQQLLALVIDDELSRISIRLEPEFFCDEAQFNIRFVPADLLAREGLDVF